MLRQGTLRVELLGADGHALLLYRVGVGQSCVLTTACLFAQEEYGAEGRAERTPVGDLLPAAAFHALLGESPEFRAFVMRGFGSRMATLLRRIEELSFRSVDRRLASLLLARGPTLTATQAEIAVEIGTAREVVTRRLAVLARNGLLSMGRGAIRMREPTHFGGWRPAPRRDDVTDGPGLDVPNRGSRNGWSVFDDPQYWPT